MEVTYKGAFYFSLWAAKVLRGYNTVLRRGRNSLTYVSAGLSDVQKKELNFQLSTLLRSDL